MFVINFLYIQRKNKHLDSTAPSTDAVANPIETVYGANRNLSRNFTVITALEVIFITVIGGLLICVGFCLMKHWTKGAGLIKQPKEQLNISKPITTTECYELIPDESPKSITKDAYDADTSDNESNISEFGRDLGMVESNTTDSDQKERKYPDEFVLPLDMNVVDTDSDETIDDD